MNALVCVSAVDAAPTADDEGSAVRHPYVICGPESLLGGRGRDKFPPTGRLGQDAAMTDSSWWVPLASGALGVIGALGGTWLTQASTRRREERQWTRLSRRQDDEWRRHRADKLRDTRGQLYLDLMEYLENVDDRLYAELNDDHVTEPISGVHERGRLNARVELYGTDELRARWAAALIAHGTVVQEWDETGGAQRVSSSTVNLAREQLEEVRNLLRRLAQDLG
jgi:hypothetical protein